MNETAQAAVNDKTPKDAQSVAFMPHKVFLRLTPTLEACPANATADPASVQCHVRILVVVDQLFASISTMWLWHTLTYHGRMTHRVQDGRRSLICSLNLAMHFDSSSLPLRLHTQEHPFSE